MLIRFIQFTFLASRQLQYVQPKSEQFCVNVMFVYCDGQLTAVWTVYIIYSLQHVNWVASCAKWRQTLVQKSHLAMSYCNHQLCAAHNIRSWHWRTENLQQIPPICLPQGYFKGACKVLLKTLRTDRESCCYSYFLVFVCDYYCDIYSLNSFRAIQVWQRSSDTCILFINICISTTITTLTDRFYNRDTSLRGTKWIYIYTKIQVNTLRANMLTTDENTAASAVGTKQICLEVNHKIQTDNKPLEVWNSLNIYEQTLRNKITFMKKLRTDWNQGMLAIIPCRIFCLPVCYPKV